jgi:hypothetical protein
MATGLDEEKQQEFKEKLDALNQVQRIKKSAPKAKDRRIAELERRFKLSEKTEVAGSVASPGENIEEEILETEEETPATEDKPKQEPEEQDEQKDNEDDQDQQKDEPDDENEEEKDKDEDEDKPEDEKEDAEQDQPDDEDKPEGEEGGEPGEEAEEGLGEGAAEGAGEGLAEGAAAEGAGAAEAAATAAEGAEAGAAATGFLASTAWLWGPALAILLGLALIFGIFMFITISAVAYCNSSGFSGLGAQAASKLSWLSGNGDFCNALAIDTTPTVRTDKRSGGAGGGTSFWEPADLVALGGVSVDPQTSDPRVRQCMLPKVQEIFAAANAAGLNVSITSAFRTGDFPSRHAFGEAVDIVIRPTPAKPWSSNTQISKLVQIAKNAGFTPAKGDTLDEYNKPIEGRTSGGHVHVEFNKISADASYCAPYTNAPAPF